MRPAVAIVLFVMCSFVVGMWVGGRYDALRPTAMATQATLVGNRDNGTATKEAMHISTPAPDRVDEVPSMSRDGSDEESPDVPVGSKAGQPMTPERTGRFTSHRHGRSQPAWVPSFQERMDVHWEKPDVSGHVRDDIDGGHEMTWGTGGRSSFEMRTAAARRGVEKYRRHNRQECKGSWRLPARATRFCRAFDGLSSLWLSRLTRLEAPAPSKLICDAHSALAVVNCASEHCAGHPELAGCIVGIPSAHCSHPSVVLPFEAVAHMPDAHDMEASEAVVLTIPSGTDGWTRGYAGYYAEALQQCADVAMQSYCSHAFQLIPERHAQCNFLDLAANADPACANRSLMLKCVTFRFYFYPKGNLQPLPSQPLFAFLHRSEWRSSLLRDDLRLVVVQGPDTTFRVNHDGHQTPLVRIGIRGRFGELVPMNVRVHLRLLLFVSECNGRANETNRTVLARREATWTSPLGNTSSSLQPESGDVDFRMRSIFFGPWVGCKLTLRAIGAPVALDTGSALPHIRKDVESMLQYDSDMVHLVRELDAAEGYTRRGPTSCAPHLFANECCVNGLAAIHVFGVRGVWRRAAHAGRWADAPVYLRLTPGVDGREHPCISIVDGHVSSFDFHGVAVFPWLVVRNRCSPQELQAYLRTPDTSNVTVELRRVRENLFIPNGSMSLHLGDFAACGDSTDTADETAPSSPAPLLVHGRSQPGGPPVLVLVSIAVHESLGALREQLENVAVFVPASVVVLHVSPSWNVRMRDIVALNGTAHPYVLVNAVRAAYSKQLLAQVQLDNARYVDAVHPWVRWTHVVLLASNELFVRGGLEAYVGSYDMSSPLRPSARSGIGVVHSFFGGRPEIRFADPEYLGRGFHYWGQAKGDGGLHGEFAFARLLRNLGLGMYATHQLYTEGSFFNRTIAVRLSRLLEAYFNQSDGDCLDSWMSYSEAFVLQLLQDACGETRNVAFKAPDNPTALEGPVGWNRTDAMVLLAEMHGARCGEKTGTVVWQSPNWFVKVDNINAARCSPFSAPFSLKRFERDSNDNIRKIVVALQSNKDAVRRPREYGAEACRNLQWHID